MKFILTLGLLFSIVISYAQIGIGNNVESFDDSEVLKIVSNNKGVLFPNISIPNLNESAPVTDPENSLFVYNTNTNTGTGFYIWKDNKWNPLINSTNIYKYLGVIKTINAVSNATRSDSTPDGANAYALGETANAHDWQLIPNLSKSFDVYASSNNVSVNVNGIVQVNSGQNNTSHSFAIAIFIDKKLASVRNFIITGYTPCLYTDFNLFMSKNNLSVGNHTVEVYETYRVNLLDTSNAVLSFGGKSNSCNNLSNDMSRSFLNIQLTENP
ncbi:hypothetical protein [Chryseobacterium sp. SNU WT5]|uniref:hypothetical protein n=1 Tax=Chryseobacterium sp. SNU WT5 TaxID=2594269 RepID=UPI001628048E|nr:hypothetical protein [Chryseobacterium sp. SNU WT5]